jgi:hypothetical protein
VAASAVLTAVAAGAVLSAAGGAGAPAPPAGWTELAVPAGPGAMAPNLARTGRGLVLSWLEPTPAGGHALRVARLDRQGFVPLGTVAEGAGFFANWADFPAVVESGDGTLVAHWLAKTASDPYAYSIELARSADGGVAWKRLGTLHADGVAAEHGFVAFAAEGPGVRAVWLDGRAMPGGGAMALRTARVDGERVSEEQVLDERVCDCCQTGMAMADGGAVVVYRDRSSAEIRDISWVRRSGSGWTAPAPVHADAWRIPGCPVNGPAIAAAGRRVVVAWFTGAATRPRVQVAFSLDGGASFGPPILIDGERPLGRVGIALDADGSALVSWLAVAGGDAAILVRRATPAGAGPSLRLAQTAQARASGFPRIVVEGDRLHVAFVEGDKQSRLRAGSVATASLPPP